MRRLHVCLLHNYRERTQTSMKLYADRLGEALAGIGVAVDRVRPPDVLPRALAELPLLSKLDSYLGRFVAYPAIARRYRGRLCHIVDHGQGYLVDALDPARTVVTCHDVILLLVAAGRLRPAFLRPTLSTAVLRRSLRAARRAAAVIAVSSRTRDDLVSVAGLDPARVRVIPPGVDPSFAPDPGAARAARERHGLGAGPVLLHVGHTAFYKNVEGCLAVLAKVRREAPARLVRVGGPLRRHQRRMARRLGVEEAVVEVGAVSGAELRALYSAADVLLFPSLYEGFGWPPLEAMACGLPVVASSAGALPETVGDAALVAPAQDHGALADHVLRVLGDGRLSASLRERGLARAARFGWDGSARRVRAVYEEVAA